MSFPSAPERDGAPLLPEMSEQSDESKFCLLDVGDSVRRSATLSCSRRLEFPPPRNNDQSLRPECEEPKRRSSDPIPGAIAEHSLSFPPLPPPRTYKTHLNSSLHFHLHKLLRHAEISTKKSLNFTFLKCQTEITETLFSSTVQLMTVWGV